MSKIAVLNIHGVQITEDGKLQKYYRVPNNYDFTNNNATDITSIENLTLFEYYYRIDYIDYRDSLYSIYTAITFSAFTLYEKQILSKNLIPIKIERDSIYSTVEMENFVSLIQLKINEVNENRLLINSSNIINTVETSNVLINNITLTQSISATTISADTIINNKIIIYSGTTPQLNSKIWTASATTINGLAIFNVTQDGTSTGTSIFNNIFSINPTPILNTSIATSVPISSIKSISSNNKIITINTIIGQSLGLLGGGSVAFCSDGTIIVITIIGN